MVWPNGCHAKEGLIERVRLGVCVSPWRLEVLLIPLTQTFAEISLTFSTSPIPSQQALLLVVHSEVDTSRYCSKADTPEMAHESRRLTRSLRVSRLT